MPRHTPSEPRLPPAPRPSSPAIGLRSLLFESAPHGMVLHDSTGMIVDANAAAQRLLAVALDQVKGTSRLHPRWEVVREDGTPMPLAEQPALVALRTGVTVDEVLLGLRRDAPAGTLWLSVSAIPMRLSNSPQPYAAIAMFVDVTAQREAIAALRASEERFRKAFEGSPLMMAISTLETGELLDVNDRYCEVLGYPRDQLIGHTLAELGVLQLAERVTLLEIIRRNGRVKNYSLSIRAHGGVDRTMLLSAEAVTIDDVPCLLVTADDITARTQMEEERSRLASHLRHLRRLESVGRLASGMAHDLNNSLTAILALAELAQLDTAPGSAAHENLQFIQDACVRGEESLRQLLELARPREAVRDTVDLNALLRDEATLLSRTTLQKVQIVVDLEESLPRIHGDGEAIRHALLTVCLNAVDVLPQGGTLMLQTRRDGDAFVRVSITDVRVALSSAGVRDADAWSFATLPAEVSERFGLSTVQEVIESQDGTMVVESAEGKAGRVTVRLPAVAAPSAML